MDVRNKIALITGGAGGIGKALALRFLKGGSRVVLWDVDPAVLEAAVRELSAEGEVRGYALDVTDRRKVAETAERVRRDVGEVDILDNNAGMVVGGDFLACPEERLLRTMEVNVHGVMWCTRAFLPGMLRKGAGHIIMMSSAAGLLGVPGMAAYAASKHAVIGLAESIRLELRRRGRRGVRISIVCPSFVRTGMFEGVKPPFGTPWLSPERIAGKIYEGVLRDRLYTREPFMVKLIPILKGFMSPSILDRMGDLLGMNEAMDHWKGH